MWPPSSATWPTWRRWSMRADPCCTSYPHPRTALGRTPYTCAELARLYGMVRDAAAADPGELGEQEIGLCRCGKHYHGAACSEGYTPPSWSRHPGGSRNALRPGLR